MKSKRKEMKSNKKQLKRNEKEPRRDPGGGARRDPIISMFWDPTKSIDENTPRGSIWSILEQHVTRAAGFGGPGRGAQEGAQTEAQGRAQRC